MLTVINTRVQYPQITAAILAHESSYGQTFAWVECSAENHEFTQSEVDEAYRRIRAFLYSELPANNFYDWQLGSCTKEQYDAAKAPITAAWQPPQI
jgi:hypothetical protein